jgi:hypothetical protein
MIGERFHRRAHLIGKLLQIAQRRLCLVQQAAKQQLCAFFHQVATGPGLFSLVRLFDRRVFHLRRRGDGDQGDGGGRSCGKGKVLHPL